jgi:hypothetical protein
MEDAGKGSMLVGDKIGMGMGLDGECFTQFLKAEEKRSPKHSDFHVKEDALFKEGRSKMGGKGEEK